MTYLLLSADYKLPSHRRIGTTERLRQADDVLGKSSASMFESDFPSSPLTAKSACIGDIMAVYEGALNLADDGQGLKSNKMKFSKSFAGATFIGPISAIFPKPRNSKRKSVQCPWIFLPLQQRRRHNGD